MSDPQNNEGSQGKSTIYFAIAGGFLLLMGLVWSLDAFFVYVTLGASIFFFYLGFRNRKVAPVEQQRHYDRPKSNPYSNPTQSARPTQAPTSKTTGSTFDALWEALKKSQSQSQGQTNQSAQSKATVAVAVGFIFFVFTIITVSVIFSDSNSVDYTADYYYQTGDNFLWENQLDSAKVYYRRAMNIEPEYEEAMTGYGNALMRLTSYDSALIMMDKALEINPGYDYAKYSKALVYFYKQNYRQSRSELFSLLKNTPDYYDAMVLAGDDYYVEQKNDSAFYWYQMAYDNGVRTAGLSRVLAEIHDSRSNRDKAIDLYRESLSYDSTNVGIYNRLGELLPGKNGDVYRNAAKRWKEAGF